MDNREIRLQNLRYAVSVFGSTAKLAEEAECSQKYLDQILQGFQGEKDKNPRKLGDNIASKIAKALNKEPYWMDQPHFELWDNKGHLSVKEEQSQYIVNKKIHTYSKGYEIRQFETGGSMGNGLILRDQPGVIQNWRVDAEWLQHNVRGASSTKNLCIVTGFGESMRPLFNPGDPLIINTAIKEYVGEFPYFFRIDGEGYIKRLQKIPGIGIRALSDNPKYEAWTITPNMDFEILKVWKSEDF